METRTISMFPDKEGFGMGSSEARCSIQYFQKANEQKEFSFKCHRDKDAKGMAYPLNSVNFHPYFGTFATCGGDGQYCIWDKDARHRVSNSIKRQMPITAATWNADGSMFVYSTGYDWSKGLEEYEKTKKMESKRPKLYVHVVKEEEVRPKAQQR
jgi:mRNA export factor